MEQQEIAIAIISILSTLLTILLPIMIKEIRHRIKYRKKMDKKLNVLLKSFKIYIDDNGNSPKIKKVIKELIKEIENG